MDIYSNIVNKQTLREVQHDTLDIITKALVNSFGPDGTTTAYRKPKDIARYTKDGHTILKNIMFNGPIEFTMRDDLEAITRRIITTVGDGTTSAIILADCIFDELMRASDNFQINEKQMVQDLQRAFKEATEFIYSNKKEATIDDIYKIALISTDGNEFIANLIKSIYEEHGMEVFIDVAVSNDVNTVVKSYDGFTIYSGLCDTAFINNTKHTCDIRNVNLYLFEDPIDTIEMSSLMYKIINDNITGPLRNKELDKIVPTCIVCPKIGADIMPVMDNLVKTLLQYPSTERTIFPINVVTNITDANYIMDLALLSGARLIKKYIDPEKQKEDQEKGIAPTLETVHEFAGHADEVVSDATKTKFINPAKMHDENNELTDIYKNRLEDLEAQLKGLQETKSNTTEIGILKRRINSFKANLVEIHVGGIAETDRDSLRDLVEDAVLNCRSAAIDGFGYGANFEALRAFNRLLVNEQKNMNNAEINDIATGKRYSIYMIIMNAYTMLLSLLYRNKTNGDPNKGILIMAESIEYDKPLNIRTDEYDGLVLSSIKSDPIILEAVGKIIGVVFLTNQFLVEGCEYNKYVKK